MPKIPRLSTKKKADISLRDERGNIRPEQKAAMKEIVRLGKSAAEPYVKSVKRIFKTILKPKKKSTIENIKSHKQRLEEAMKGNF